MKIFCPWYCVPKGLIKIGKKNFALERLALCIRWRSKRALEAHRVKTLDSNGEALEKKRSFAWVAGH